GHGRNQPPPAQGVYELSARSDKIPIWHLVTGIFVGGCELLGADEGRPHGVKLVADVEKRPKDPPGELILGLPPELPPPGMQPSPRHERRPQGSNPGGKF